MPQVRSIAPQRGQRLRSRRPPAAGAPCSGAQDRHAAGIGALPGLLSLGAKLIQTNFPLKTAKNYVSVVQHLGTATSPVRARAAYDYHPNTALTKGDWTSRLKLSLVSSLSVYLFGSGSRYYGMEGVMPAPCASQN